MDTNAWDHLVCDAPAREAGAWEQLILFPTYSTNQQTSSRKSIITTSLPKNFEQKNYVNYWFWGLTLLDSRVKEGNSETPTEEMQFYNLLKRNSASL